MTLTHLTQPDEASRWLRSRITGQLRSDSRQVRPGDAFLAWPGAAHDGRRHVADALSAGAVACLVEHEGVDAFGFDDDRIATLPGLKAATGLIADSLQRHPSRSLRMVATTGTNGKTSTAWWMAQALTRVGRPCGVVGTLGIGQPPVPGQSEGQITPTGLTTPDPVVLQAGLRRMVEQGLGACAIEASSIGLAEHRLAGCAIEVALFTNFTRDHLDYHGDMEHYWLAKRQLFGWPGLRAAVINVDDPQGASLVAWLAGKGPSLWTVSVEGEARLWAHDVSYHPEGLGFLLSEGAQEVEVRTGLIGDYNIGNLLLVIAGMRALGVPLADAARAAAAVTPVPGRMQRVAGPIDGPEVVVDYAHTPDALDKALGALRPLAQSRQGQLWCVFGCGGNRDATKRPIMGGLAVHLADRVVITSDNPRDEDPLLIIQHISAGISAESVAKARIQADRRQAITETLAAAGPHDVVLIAGKGHEDYQEIAGVRLPFSDLGIAQQALAARGAAA